MHPSQRFLSCCLLASALLAPGLVHADFTGLRVKPQTWTIQGKEAPQGLQLSVGNDDLGVGPISLMPGNPQLSSSGSFGAARSTNTWADWQPFNNGWRTSVGLVWRQSFQTDAISGSGSESSAIPFLGLGWSGNVVPQSNWRLSAEMGAYMAGSNDCASLTAGCRNLSSPGLRIAPQENGIRVTPYLSIGASYLY